MKENLYRIVNLRSSCFEAHLCDVTNMRLNKILNSAEFQKTAAYSVKQNKIWNHMN